MTKVDATYPALLAVVRGIDVLALVVLVAVPVVLLMLAPESLWEWARPPHYPPWSPAYTSPFRSSSLSTLPETVLTLAIGFGAGVVRANIGKHWPSFRERAGRQEDRS